MGDYSKILSEVKYKKHYREGLKLLTPKQMLQRLPIALAQEKAGNTSENLLNEIRNITYSLYQAKENNKKIIQQYNQFNKVIKQNGNSIYEF